MHQHIQHTASADKKEYFEGNILILIYEINLRNYHISSNKHP